MTQEFNLHTSEGVAVAEQDRVASEGAAVCRALIPGSAESKSWWESNPYPKNTVRHDIWQAGYEAEAECIGSEGCDW